MQCYLLRQNMPTFKRQSWRIVGVSPLTLKKSKKSTAVKGHILFCDYILSIDDFKILTTSDSHFYVKVNESVLISCDEPILNKNKTSLPLYLFD